MPTEPLLPRQIAALLAQTALLALLQSLPLPFDRPQLLVSLAVSVTGMLSLNAAMGFGAVCGVLTDLLGSNGVGCGAVSLTLLCAALSHLLHGVLQNRFLTLLSLSLGAAALFHGSYWLFFRALQPESGYLFFFHYLPRILLTWLAALPLYAVNTRLLRRRKHGR